MWQIHNRLPARLCDSTRTPGPQSRQGAKQQCFVGPRSPDDQYALSGPYDHLPLVQLFAADWSIDLKILDSEQLGIAGRVADTAAVLLQRAGRGQGLAEVRDPQQRR